MGRARKKTHVNIHAHARASQICLQNIGGQEPHCPMADRIFGSKSDPIFRSKFGPQNGVQNWITFSCLLLNLCLGPVLGSGVGPKNGVRFGPKNAVSHRRILPRPAKVFSADLRCTPQEHDRKHMLFLPVGPTVLHEQWRSLYGGHVSTSFLDPVLGVMMKQVCSQTLKSLAAECHVGIRFGAASFLTDSVCVD